MRLIIGVLSAGLLAGASTAEARPAKACRVFIEVDGGIVSRTNTQPKAACEYGGKVSFIVSNLDNADYKLEVRNFRFDSTNPGVCNPSGTVGNSPINGSDNNAFKFNLNPEAVTTKKKQVKANTMRTECYKFDIYLFPDSGSTALDHLDPDLEISDPGTLPPIKKPGPGDSRR